MKFSELLETAIFGERNTSRFSKSFKSESILSAFFLVLEDRELCSNPFALHLKLIYFQVPLKGATPFSCCRIKLQFSNRACKASPISARFLIPASSEGFPTSPCLAGTWVRQKLHWVVATNPACANEALEVQNKMVWVAVKFTLSVTSEYIKNLSTITADLSYSPAPIVFLSRTSNNLCFIGLGTR